MCLWERERERLTYHAERTSREEWRGARWLRACDRGSVRWEVVRWMTEVWILVANGGIHLHRALFLKHAIRSSPALCWATRLQPLSPVFKQPSVNLYLEENLYLFNPIHLVVKQKPLRSFMQLEKHTTTKAAVGNLPRWNGLFQLLIHSLDVKQLGHFALCKIWNASSSHFTS